MNILGSFWDFAVFLFWTFVFVAYLIVLFSVAADIFRDRHLNGWLKALWILFLIFLPFITVLIYVIARGRGMAERQVSSAEESRQLTDSYIRNVATSTSPSQEIGQAKQLLDAGTITASEFAAIKATAMGTQYSSRDTV
ncbi:PLDc N-terminal domain-containing protein [Cryobacterium sp. CG_9.6]|uniref:PLDc N-terminal domain-containing protein n=1 Tax=Cryobacterium sp. CG_9.6 TaxID=2760710 RepID=UPI0024762771|nr:PLDc N-terminal domain-containing protein [Cryobacterium sp. CG_9.6]MDH6236522.1 putative membrane protein [Cryobacterium sp. CG_9.6]